MIGLIGIKIKYSGTAAVIAKGMGATTKFVRDVLEWAYIAVGRRWHGEIRPKHFTRAGASEYDYLPRSGEPGRPARVKFLETYTGGKLTDYGHTLPLVLSGESQAATQRAEIRATSKGVKVAMDGGNLTWPTKSGINMREELTAISERDKRLLGHTMDRVMEIKFKRAQGTHTTQTK